MVKLSNNVRWSIWGVDLICGAIVATLSCVALWLLVTYFDRSGQEMVGMRDELGRARQTLATLQVSNTAQQSEIQQQTVDLVERGTLPNQFPSDDYFENLTTLAAEAGVTIQSQVPMVAAQYPGLVEERSQFEISGSLQAILAFFESIEKSAYWADVGFFSLAQGGETSSLKRNAKFTISMFSAQASDAGQPKDGSS